MSGVAADVWRVAADIVEKSGYDDWSSDLENEIRGAILAERKRCADIAKLAGTCRPGGALGANNGPEHQRGCFDAATWIWTEIMEPNA